MKNFNLDNLEKKTPYKIPENFFEEVQENVLHKIENKTTKETKFFKLNFSVVTSIAAALALVFGLTFLWKTNQTDLINSSQETTASIAHQEEITPNSSTPALANNTVLIENSAPKQEIENTKTSESEITNQIVNSKNIDENYEQLLNALTDEELAELSKNTDQDIYLELFN